MRRPFEALGAVLVGLLVYLGALTAYHVVTARPVSWPQEWIGIGAFVVGAFVARGLWR